MNILLAEKRLTEGPFEPAPKLEEQHLSGNPLDPVRIDTMIVGDGINAIRPGTQIDFAPGVTVIFGENGSGKSGFVRVLKRAAGVRTAEDVLPNIRVASPPTPSASFAITVGAASQRLEWKNELGIVPLNRLSVFDTRGARLHVEEDLTYVYTPGELSLFPFVQSGIERVRIALERAITARTPGSNSLLSSFDRACSIYPTIETLGAATDLEDIRKYAVLPEMSESIVDSLKVEIDALRSTHTQNELRRARDRAAVVESLKNAVDIVQNFDVARYGTLLDACREATRRRDEAGSRAFESLGIPAVLSSEWRAFIQAGEDYLKRHMDGGYPHTADSCLYCRQPLGAKALELIKKYRSFTNNDIKRAVDRAEQDLREYIAPVAGLKIELLAEQHAAESNGENDVLASIGSTIGEISKLVAATKTSTAIEWPDRHGALDGAQKVLTGEVERLTPLIVSLQASAEQREQALRRKQAELNELQGKLIAKRLLPQIEKRVADAKWVSRANIVRNGIPAVLRSLTDAAKEASDELLNKGFEKRFQQECRNLRAPPVTLNFPGRQGQVTRRKTVGAHKPTQILSEGEQKALALADFLAEVTAVTASSPVVFDDPITSMDYRRIHEVCDRIIALANDHQIIAFTHNIWFAAELLSKADRRRWKYYDIRSEGADAGVLSAANHPRVDTIAQVSGRVKQIMEAAGGADGEVRGALVEKGYEALRGLCEIVVEHEMLKGVVQRYAPNVMMTKVEKINVDKLGESTSVIIPIFDKACRYIASHSQPIETQGIRPTLEELRTDYYAVLKAREPHKE